MAVRTKKPTAPELGRKGAYVLRNRAALLKATQEVLAVKGHAATVEDIAAHADIAVSTVYKHYKDKDALIAASIMTAFQEWEIWAESFVSDSSDPLEQLVVPMRVFVRLHQTHPHHALTLVNFFDVTARIVPQLQEKLSSHIKSLCKAGILKLDNPATTAKSLHAVLTFAVINQVIDPKSTVKDCDDAVRIALEMLGLSPAKAKKLVSHPITGLKLTNPSSL